MSGIRALDHPTLAGAILGIASGLAQAQSGFREAAKLVPSDPSFGAFFGDAVAISGDTIAVSASRKAGTVADEGAVYVFRRNSASPSTWTEVAMLSPSPPAPYFGQALGLSGDTLVVMHDSIVPPATRSALVYERDSGGPEAWGLVAVVPGVAYFGLGDNVDVDRDTLAVGSVWQNSGLSEVVIHERDLGGAGAWGFSAGLPSPQRALAVCDYFGWSVELRLDTLLISAPGDVFGAGCGGAGTVYAYERSGSEWNKVDDLRGGPGVVEFGRAVGLDDSSAARAAIGARGEVQVFERIGAEDDWVRTARFQRVSPTFGSSVTLRGNRLLVGDPGFETGVVVPFEREDDWIARPALVPSDTKSGDRFGDAVAFAGRTLVVGAPNHAAGAPFSGAAYVFTVPPGKLVEPTVPPVSAGSVVAPSTKP